MVYIEYIKQGYGKDALYCILDYLNLRHSPFIPFYSLIAESRDSSLVFFVGDTRVIGPHLSRHKLRMLVDPK